MIEFDIDKEDFRYFQYGRKRNRKYYKHLTDDMNETGCRKGLFDMWLKTYKEDSDYEVMDCDNGCYIVKIRNFGKEMKDMVCCTNVSHIE